MEWDITDFKKTGGIVCTENVFVSSVLQRKSQINEKHFKSELVAMRNLCSPFCKSCFQLTIVLSESNHHGPEWG